jgi:Zn2+/Cd2+-exporting ATPase
MAAAARSESDVKDPKCLARSVADALTQEPRLEAVTIDLTRKNISVATLGRADDPALTERIAGTVREAQEAPGDQRCCLVSGHGDCVTCELPLSAEEQGRISVKRGRDAMTIARVTCPTAPRFWRWRDVPWPKVVQRDVEFLETPEHLDEWKGQLTAAIVCGLCGLTGFLLRGTPWSLWAYLLAYAAGGWFTVQEVWERLRKSTIDVHFLMLAVALGSATIGAWSEGAMLLFLFSFSGALEHYALGRTQREIHSLFRNAPKSALVLGTDGRESELPVVQLRPGMRLLIKPDGQFPVDAEIVKGRTAADESNLTGEATPVEKSVGDSVLAGTLNLWGAVEVSVVRQASESALERIIRLIKEAQRQKAPAQQFTDRFGAWYTYAVLGLSLAMFFVWWLGLGLPALTSSQTHHTAFYRTMTLLVVASPCALVLSIPSAVLAAIAWGARHGILFRGGAAVEKLASTTLVALDKTGTLTTGELRVQTVETFPRGREQELAELAYSLERLSTHPLARAITRYGKQHGLQTIEFDHFESVAGQGLRGRRGDRVCSLGKREWLIRAVPEGVPANLDGANAGLSEVWVREGDLLGRIVLRDDIRPQAQQVVRELRSEGLRTVVLTGDRRSSAEHLQQQLGLDDVRAELKPEEKVRTIQALMKAKEFVAMVGDGVNDAPSLAAAHTGVAMGARGSDAALEQADVVLMHDRIENFLAAFRLSERAHRVIRQNLVISLGTVLVLVCFALAGSIPLTVGVVGHEGSTVVVVMNSLRLLFGAGRSNPRRRSNAGDTAS